MQELITRLTEKAGISPEQAASAIDTVKDFVKEKFPMMAGAVDNLFAANAPAAGSDTAAAPNAGGAGGLIDKISDVIPGEAGQKVEDFVKDKLGGFLG